MHVIVDAHVGDLDPARQLVLLTLRALDQQRVGRLAMCVHNALWSVFGPAYVELALRGIEGAHRALADHGRRPPVLLRPVDDRIAGMEVCVLELLCATAHGHGEYRDALCTWLVHRPGVAPLRCCAALTVRALDCRRLPLPPPADGAVHAPLSGCRPRPVANARGAGDRLRRAVTGATAR